MGIERHFPNICCCYTSRCDWPSSMTVVPSLFSLAYPLAAYIHKLYPSYQCTRTPEGMLGITGSGCQHFITCVPLGSLFPYILPFTLAYAYPRLGITALWRPFHILHYTMGLSPTVSSTLIFFRISGLRYAHNMLLMAKRKNYERQ
jgi:hypothetical protein